MSKPSRASRNRNRSRYLPRVNTPKTRRWILNLLDDLAPVTPLEDPMRILGHPPRPRRRKR